MPDCRINNWSLQLDYSPVPDAISPVFTSFVIQILTQDNQFRIFCTTTTPISKRTDERSLLPLNDGQSIIVVSKDYPIAQRRHSSVRYTLSAVRQS